MAELEVGRELDALIAERVMGWKIGKERIVRPDGSSFDAPESGMPGDHVYDRYSIPHYSTDIAAAWQVVEKLGDKFHCRISTPFFDGRPCFAGFTRKGTTGWNGKPDFEASGDTVPAAICRAALKEVKLNDKS